MGIPAMSAAPKKEIIVFNEANPTNPTMNKDANPVMNKDYTPNKTGPKGSF